MRPLGLEPSLVRGKNPVPYRSGVRREKSVGIESNDPCRSGRFTATLEHQLHPTEDRPNAPGWRPVDLSMTNYAIVKEQRSANGHAVRHRAAIRRELKVRKRRPGSGKKPELSKVWTAARWSGFAQLAKYRPLVPGIGKRDQAVAGTSKSSGSAGSASSRKSARRISARFKCRVKTE